MKTPALLFVALLLVAAASIPVAGSRDRVADSARESHLQDSHRSTPPVDPGTASNPSAATPPADDKTGRNSPDHDDDRNTPHGDSPSGRNPVHLMHFGGYFLLTAVLFAMVARARRPRIHIVELIAYSLLLAAAIVELRSR